MSQQLREKSKRLLTENKLDLIIVDNLQFIRGYEGPATSNKNPNYIDLKILTHELNVPILAGLQLTRNNERRMDKRPRLSDLHEFGSLEDAADVIMFIYHPDLYEISSVKASVAELIVAKHNYGPVGSIELLYRPDLAKFENAATRVFRPEQDD